MKYVLIGLLRAYRFAISPLYGQVCRYYPSCSEYALDAVRIHGSIRGSWLAARRLLRCHPWAPGGVDKVPPKRTKTNQDTQTSDTGTNDTETSTTTSSAPSSALSTHPQGV